VAQRVISQQRKKEALKLHSHDSAESSLNALECSMVSPSDAGHTFSLQQPQAQKQQEQEQEPEEGEIMGNDLGNIPENSDEMLTTGEWQEARDQEPAAAAVSFPVYWCC